MEITHQYAQSIVDRTMKILGYNINIMNSIGIIVGSGDKKRINTFHQGAAEVIKTGRPLEITSDQARKLEGVKPGVNLPIYLNEKIAGVVGITGEPEEVRPYGELLKISVETMLQQAFLSEQLRMEQNARELYVDDVIRGNFAENEDIFLAKGTVLGFDMKIPRVAVVLKIYGLNEKINDLPAREDELKLQKRREKILDRIKQAFSNPQNMFSYSGSNIFIIFYAIKNLDNVKLKKEIWNSIFSVKDIFEKYNLTFLATVGSFYPGLSGLKKSYDEAVKALEIQEQIKKADKEKGTITLAQDVSLEILLANIPQDMLHRFKKLLLSHNQQLIIMNQEKLVETLKTFFKSDLNISTAAEKLGVTRNTLSSRLDKVKELTGYDPRKFFDAVKLELLILIEEFRLS
ncbi:transcriptional regulator CdaR [Biomaibacter acetigenes]|uniref:Transcriptional regulator CdaR n=1 Tax=Biomaibacter acetigenes TaxID=2316383 RepID=A0A3G2R6P7_9FIRM|nr:sugar diacid recognition domain-containing protein [Biomaibacter acetigenes]AYO31086.1 transcriptional regulator CdaR [Biomaibacter acetigenes]